MKVVITNSLSNIQTPQVRRLHSFSLFYKNVDSIELKIQFRISVVQTLNPSKL